MTGPLTETRTTVGMPESPTPEAGAPAELVSVERSCEQCGEQFDPRYSRDGQHCFVCSVHATCACADEPLPR